MALAGLIVGPLSDAVSVVCSGVWVVWLLVTAVWSSIVADPAASALKKR